MLQLSLLRNLIHVIFILICYISRNSCTSRTESYMQCPFQYIVPRIICLPDVSHLNSQIHMIVVDFFFNTLDVF